MIDGWNPIHQRREMDGIVSGVWVDRDVGFDPEWET